MQRSVTKSMFRGRGWLKDNFDKTKRNKVSIGGYLDAIKLEAKQKKCDSHVTAVKTTGHVTYN